MIVEKKIPARLHVLLARQSHTGLVIRRGPSKHVGVFAWDRRTNEFELAQWLKGRIYERRSDLSPDGKYWIYMAMNGHWGDNSIGSWTTIARAPWLKAITLYPKNSCWNGGGLFCTNKSYWLDENEDIKAKVKSSEVRRIKDYKLFGDYGGECLHVYYNRLQRDGWSMIGDKNNAIFLKSISNNWTLKKICHAQINSPEGKGCYWDEHQLISPSGEIFEYPSWEWAEWVDDAIFFAERGCLYKISVSNADGIGLSELIHDFNEYKFEAIKAPYGFAY